MKGKEWHKAFVPHGAPDDTPGIPAVTLQAGEQLLGMPCVLTLPNSSTN